MALARYYATKRFIAPQGNSSPGRRLGIHNREHIMPIRKANAEWLGNFEDGKGIIRFGDGRFEEPYTADSRFGAGTQTNPEELIAAAHAACFSMAFAKVLADAGKPADRIETAAEVNLEKQGEGFGIATITLTTGAAAPGLEDDALRECAEAAKTNCPVSQALAGCAIKLVVRKL